MVDVEIKRGDEVAPGVIPCLLPQDVLAWLLKCKLTISNKLCREYWQHLENVQDEVAVFSHQFRSMLDNEAWPLGLHGDEAAIGLVSAPFDKIIGVFLNIPLFRPKSTRLSRWLLFAVENTKVASVQQTLNPVLAKIVESLNFCTENGVLGRRFVVTELRGDQAWFRYLFVHKSWWKATEICFRCKATTKQTSCNYCLYDGWEGTCRTTEEFVAEELPDNYSY